MGNFYPTLVSEKLNTTINFYEDYFGFVPAFEEDGYALLQNGKNPANQIAVFDASHECVSRYDKTAQGVIISIAVDDIEAAYDTLYMEGLEIYKEFGTDIHGRRHFVVYDPNGILVNVLESLEVRAMASA